MSELQVRRDELTKTRIVDSSNSGDGTPLADGQILVKIDQFAFTANNITYGVVGDQLGYWQFFPPTGDATQGWGLIPVWGFADVVQSACLRKCLSAIDCSAIFRRRSTSY